MAAYLGGFSELAGWLSFAGVSFGCVCAGFEADAAIGAYFCSEFVHGAASAGVGANAPVSSVMNGTMRP